MDAANDFYSKLAQIIVDGISEPWSRVELHAELDEGTGETTTSYWSTAGEEKQVFLGSKLYPVLKELRQQMSKSERGLWYVLDFKLAPDGKFVVDFGYEKAPWMNF